jgi:hypothetical protein
MYALYRNIQTTWWYREPFNITEGVGYIDRREARQAGEEADSRLPTVHISFLFIFQN